MAVEEYTALAVTDKSKAWVLKGADANTRTGALYR